ncbi:hypothetical protein [Rhodococcus sp. ARC_M6]|uniref:hypothetical protein n=1 Tax=Rhodococcus sp. ARC_M6 TaxID=2928852 RepID=UPI001FB50C91|nr:hypothetical protein [Rhodococcus sp. ARC_M6]MCJ0907325.1 hypothetical protein [Rhodococcus sp. ARC_M6]
MKRLLLVLAFTTLAASGCSSTDGTVDAPTSSMAAIATTTTTAPITTTELPPPVMADLTYEEPVSEVSTYEEPTYETEPTIEYVTLFQGCSTHGASAMTEYGETAYCSRVARTDAWIWSVTQGVTPYIELPSTPDVVAPTNYQTAPESAVQICMAKTGQTLKKCTADLHGG